MLPVAHPPKEPSQPFPCPTQSMPCTDSQSLPQGVLSVLWLRISSQGLTIGAQGASSQAIWCVTVTCLAHGPLCLWQGTMGRNWLSGWLFSQDPVPQVSCHPGLRSFYSDRMKAGHSLCPGSHLVLIVPVSSQGPAAVLFYSSKCPDLLLHSQHCPPPRMHSLHLLCTSPPMLPVPSLHCPMPPSALHHPCMSPIPHTIPSLQPAVAFVICELNYFFKRNMLEKAFEQLSCPTVLLS